MHLWLLPCLIVRLELTCYDAAMMRKQQDQLESSEVVFLFAIVLAGFSYVEGGEFLWFCLVSSIQSTGFYSKQSTLLRCILITAGKCHPRNRNKFDWLK
jgi:hypothetical protein